MKSTKFKTKTEKGITLIALIITIVVLMILAAAAINSITNDGIIGKAESVKNTYTEAQNEEQKMLDYYELVLEGKAWTQNGTTVSRNGQTLNVGEKVNLKVGTADAVEYSDSIAEGAEGDYTGDWVVLGVEYGKLLLVSATNLEEVTLGGAYGGNIKGTECAAGYYNGVEYLHNLCSKYKNPTFADNARSVTVEDINRITGFKPESDSRYGKTFTLTEDSVKSVCEGYVHIDGREIGKNGVTSVEETNTTYGYSNTILVSSNPNLSTIFDYANQSGYWLASCSVNCYDYLTSWNLRIVVEDMVVQMDVWLSGNDPGMDFGAMCRTSSTRAVVSIKPEVQVVKAS